MNEQSAYQVNVSFPDWNGNVDDSLAMNSMFSFKGYHGQGEMIVSVREGVQSFHLHVNGRRIDTSLLTGGSVHTLDIHNLVRDGRNTFTVTCITPRDLEKAVTVQIPYPVILPGEASEAGLDPEALQIIDDIFTCDVSRGFPAAQLAIIRNGRMVYSKAWGSVLTYMPDGTPVPDPKPAGTDTLFDLASNTKMYTVNYALQYLVTRGLIRTDAHIHEFLGPAFYEDVIAIPFAGKDPVDLATIREWKKSLTLRDVLCHEAGFPADPQYHNDRYDQVNQRYDPDVRNVLYSGSDGSTRTREKTLEALCKTPLMYQPGTQTVYSDADYMLLGFVVESVTGKDLNTFLRETFWEPMGLKHITYNPLRNGFAPEDCASTELNGNTRDGGISFTGVRKYTLRGEVHDEKAFYAMGGISGHAGLFASAEDLAKLASVMLTGGYGENRFFSPNVMDLFTSPKSLAVPHWSLGWYRQADNARPWYFSTHTSRNTFGHNGWTGTLTMIDPERELVIVILTNKISSPVTDKARNLNRFNGGRYTSATFGFIPELLMPRLDFPDPDPDALDRQLLDMISEKRRLVDSEAPSTAAHPVVQALYSLCDVLALRAARLHNAALLAEVFPLLDNERDQDEIEKLKYCMEAIKPC